MDQGLGRELPLTATAIAARWTAEAERLHLRYQVEIVEALGLCPWAERARLGSAFRARVLLQSDARVEATLHALDTLSSEAQIEVAVLIYPRLDVRRIEFERFIAGVHQAYVPRHPDGCVPFVFAAFHPEASPDASGADRLIPFLRRTPDPTLQILRSTVLDRVRSGRPQGTQFVDARVLNFDAPQAPPRLADRIADANLAIVDRVGVEELTRRFDSIADDRRQTYRELDGLGDCSE